MSAEQNKIDSLSAVLDEVAENTVAAGTSHKLGEIAEDQARLQPAPEDERPPAKTQWYINPSHLIGDLDIS